MERAEVGKNHVGLLSSSRQTPSWIIWVSRYRILPRPTPFFIGGLFLKVFLFG